MTDEEKAEEYAENEQCAYCSNPQYCQGKDECYDFANIKSHFLAGLEAGKDMASTDLAVVAYMQGAERYKMKWHDLRKDPMNLPNNLRSVWTNVGASYYDHTDHCWRDEFGRTQGVIAWCEPKFEEQLCLRKKQKNIVCIKAFQKM